MMREALGEGGREAPDLEGAAMAKRRTLFWKEPWRPHGLTGIHQPHTFPAQEEIRPISKDLRRGQQKGRGRWGRVRTTKVMAEGREEPRDKRGEVEKSLSPLEGLCPLLYARCPANLRHTRF